MASTYVQAHTVAEAVAALANGARPIAGGTDLVVGARQGRKPLPESLVGIHRIGELHEVMGSDAGLLLGALVTHGSIVSNPEIRHRYTALADASAIVGSHATRANGTLGGNVMNASPAMDTGAPLLCFGAIATLRGPSGARSMALDRLWTGPGTTAASPEELLVSIELPAPPPGTGSAYVRLQYRRQMDIAVVGVATVVTVVNGVVTDARIGMSALSPVVQRVEPAEAALVGSDGGEAALTAAGAALAEAARPISDVRASAGYRRAMAEVITGRSIRAALIRAGGGQVPIPASDSTFGS